ncbi:YigZ family protein [Sulfurimonas sp.]|nr:YigZ family protein [Sulfurimonas sp.]
MKFVDKHYTQTLEIKQSKFISHLIPYALYTQTLQELKQLHPKARHFVVAYRYLNEFKQVVEHSSDDGEPKGTSGKPTLMVLQGTNMINTAIITVRYFGGTKLGTGGLVRAYSDATNLVLGIANTIDYKEEVNIKIEFEYANIRKVDYECSMNNIEVVDKTFSDTTQYLLKSDKASIQIFLEKMDRLIQVT